MNIIISPDKQVRLTQCQDDAYNIRDISFYISKQLSYTDIYLKLVINRNEYPFFLEEMGYAVNYSVYKVIFVEPVSLSCREYELVLCIDEVEISLGKHLIDAIEVQGYTERAVFARLRNANVPKPLYGLTDKDEPVDIINKTISFSNQQNVLVAEDNISQLITFCMEPTYEGITMINKQFYFDYLTPDGQLFNLELINKEEKTDATGKKYLYLYFPVPYEVTQYGRNIPFAISAIDLGLTSDAADANGAVNPKAQQYIWQTLPATLFVLPNLAKRNEVPLSSGDDASTLVALLNELDNRQTAIEESDIYNLDAEQPTNQEVILNGGGTE